MISRQDSEDKHEESKEDRREPKSADRHEVNPEDKRRANSASSDAAQYYLGLPESMQKDIRDEFWDLMRLLPDNMPAAKFRELCQYLSVFCDFFRINRCKITLDENPNNDEMDRLFDELEEIEIDIIEHLEKAEQYEARKKELDRQIDEAADRSFNDILDQCKLSVKVEAQQRWGVLGWAAKPWDEVREPNIDDIALGLDRLSPEDRKKIYWGAHGIMRFMRQYHLPDETIDKLISAARRLQLARDACEENKVMAKDYGTFFLDITSSIA